MRQQRGFTLIELVIVIVILGVLAATALPRFVDLSSDAREAKLRAASGAMKSASAIAHATALARNLSGGSLTMDGAEVALFNYYLEADSDGIILAAGIAADEGYTINGGGNGASQTVTVQVAGAPTPTECQVTYTSPVETVGAIPSFKLSTGGC